MVDGIEVTMIDYGMPVVVLRARDLGVSGRETPQALEDNVDLCARLERIRLACGPLMQLGDVTEKTVPKMTMLSPPTQGGAISTRSFIPHRCHKAIGVLGAISVAGACLIRGTVAFDMAMRGTGETRALSVEHPTGAMTVLARLGSDGVVQGAAILRTARKLMDGEIFA